jgi:hypothetical protein
MDKYLCPQTLLVVVCENKLQNDARLSKQVSKYGFHIDPHHDSNLTLNIFKKKKRFLNLAMCCTFHLNPTLGDFDWDPVKSSNFCMHGQRQISGVQIFYRLCAYSNQIFFVLACFTSTLQRQFCEAHCASYIKAI